MTPSNQQGIGSFEAASINGPVVDHNITFSEVVNEINNGRLVAFEGKMFFRLKDAIRYEKEMPKAEKFKGKKLPTSYNHFLVISGYDLDHQTVIVNDPMFGGHQEMLFDTFLKNYQHHGRMFGTYLTIKPKR